MLHDVGHSPFSHTFEKYYDIPPCLDDKLAESALDDEFVRDLNLSLDSKQHEKLSALLVITRFRKIIAEKFELDPVLVARMIIRCHYKSDNEDKKKRFYNCFMDLLNGKSIDVDKLDYVSRDQWISGFSGGSIDIERLLSSVCIISHYNAFQVCYYKRAISEIESVIDIKNFLNLWIFSHHKVIYDQYVLDQAVKKMAIALSHKNPTLALSDIFNYRSFYEPLYLNGHPIYLPTDDDLVYLMKTYASSNPYVNEWLYRKHELKPLWKTYPEFYAVFKDLSQSSRGKSGSLFKNAPKVIERFLEEKGLPGERYYIKGLEPDLTSIQKRELFLLINQEPICYTDLGLQKRKENSQIFYFLVYVPKEIISEKKELIDRLLNAGQD